MATRFVAEKKTRFVVKPRHEFDHEFSHEIIVLTVQLTENRLPLYSWLPSIHFSYFLLVFTIVLLLGIGVRFINKFV